MNSTGTRTTPSRAIKNDKTANCQQLCDSSASRSPLPQPFGRQGGRCPRHRRLQLCERQPGLATDDGQLAGTRAAVRCSISLDALPPGQPCQRAADVLSHDPSPPAGSYANRARPGGIQRGESHPADTGRIDIQHARTSPNARATYRAGPPPGTGRKGCAAPAPRAARTVRLGGPPAPPAPSMCPTPATSPSPAMAAWPLLPRWSWHATPACPAAPRAHRRRRLRRAIYRPNRSTRSSHAGDQFAQRGIDQAGDLVPGPAPRRAVRTGPRRCDQRVERLGR